MMSAEKWFEMDRKYKKHGIDMKPVEKTKKIKKINEVREISWKDKFMVMFFLVVSGALLVSIIISTAYTSKIKYSINQIERRNMEIISEIENLELELNRANNIDYIEQKAVTELGMSQPKNIVYLEEDKEIVTDFAFVSKEESYN